MFLDTPNIHIVGHRVLGRIALQKVALPPSFHGIFKKLNYIEWTAILTVSTIALTLHLSLEPPPPLLFQLHPQASLKRSKRTTHDGVEVAAALVLALALAVAEAAAAVAVVALATTVPLVAAAAAAAAGARNHRRTS